MDKFKKIASLEELEALKNLIHYENSGEHKPQDKREKILVDFTKPTGRIKSISENSESTVVVTLQCDDICKELSEVKIQALDIAEKFVRNAKGIIKDDTKYIQILSSPDTTDIPCRKYFEMYSVCAMALKNEFPDIKIGAAGFSDPVCDYVHEFLNYLSNDKRVPFDFFSWHKSASKAEQVQNYTYAARTLLDKYGFTETENIITSWSYGISQSSGSVDEFQMKEAAFAAATLISLQKTPTDIAVYGKENFGENKKCRLAFEAFQKLSALGIEVTSDTAADHVYVAGAKNDDKGAFILASFNPYEKLSHELVFDLKGVFGKKCEIYLVDTERNLELVYSGDIPESYMLEAETILLVKLV